jgi:Gpi18-like mannosyltransferase
LKNFLYCFYAYFTHRIYKMIFPKKILPFFLAALFLQLTNIACAVLCLFNDIFIALPMSICILRFMEQKYHQGIIWFIIASTFKIGAIFYLPAILLVITLMSGLTNVIYFVLLLIGV